MKVGIVGLGLMGGSLARALKATQAPPSVLAWDTDRQSLDAALEAGAVNRAAPDAAALASASDVVVYATPLGTTLDLLGRHHGLWKADALVMDIASLKLPVRHRIEVLGSLDRWVGAHPMTGGERTGFAASRSDLYRGTTVWLTAAEGAHPLGNRAQRFWTAVGATWRWIEAAEHDRRMLVASHLPQLVSNTLAALVAGAGLERAELGPGGRDMTRLAGSSPELWRPLLEASRSALAPVVRDLSTRLDSLASHLEAGDLDRIDALMSRTRTWKEGGRWS